MPIFCSFFWGGRRVYMDGYLVGWLVGWLDGWFCDVYVG